MSNREMNTWQMVNIGHELYEMANNLNCLAAQFNRGANDKELYEDTLSQVEHCHIRLKAIWGRKE